MTSRTEELSLQIGDTQPTAALSPVPFATPEFGALGTDDRFCFNQTDRCLVLPLLTASPSGTPAANTAYFWINNATGTYTLKIKIAAGTVLATGSLS
jgi:hypothetical protein